jgi:hypothetical protein
MRTTIALPATALTALGLAACGDVTGPDFAEPRYTSVVIEGQWHGDVLPGDHVEIKGIVGTIEAATAPNQEVVVTWTKRGRQYDPAGVTVEVLRHADGITICAVYPDLPGRPMNECLPGERGNMVVQGNDVAVDFTVTVPVGVDFIGRTVSGNIYADNLQSDAFSSTVSGNVNITTSELAEASTVSGSIEASIGRSDWNRGLAFTTVSGSVAVAIPENTNAEVWATTVTGNIFSDFSLPVLQDGSIRGSLGGGGALLRLSAVAGSIILRSGS